MTLSTKTPKPKVCRCCKTLFTPQRMGAKVCSPYCALTFAKSERAKAEKVAAVKDRRETRAKLDSIKSKSQRTKETQTAFNAWIRARDHDRPCISCGRHHGGQYHAGHYLSVGARPEIRFEPLNVWKQCAPCNTHLSGNAVLFRQALAREIGIEKVEWLEGPHPMPKYTNDELDAIKADYTARTRALLKAKND